MDTAAVRQSVAHFAERTAKSGGEAHCFAAWYLHQRFHLSETVAMQQSSDGNYDFGIDGFHLEQPASDKSAVLTLIQAKYTESIQHISKGFKDLEKALPEVAQSLEGTGTGEPIQNKVLVNLRAALNKLSDEARSSLTLDFEVLHLSIEDEAVLGVKFQQARNRLAEALADLLESHKCKVRHVGPKDLGPPDTIVVPPQEVRLRLTGHYDFPAGASGVLYFGMGRLADLVDLYRNRRDDLFARNVRYYLMSKKNTEKGPAGKMRATLKQMTIEGVGEPECFAMYHNGITLFARSSEPVTDGILLRDPYVLNGCQTIKNAFLFRHDGLLKSKIKEDLWQRVAVPIRVVRTKDEDLLRTITVNNNRQNSMSPAALRSNDVVQIRLEQRFKQRQIVYQRQEGAFDAIWASRPETLEDLYENTQGSWVDLREIARAIAAAAGEISLALHPNDLFESDSAYRRCFDEKKRLRSIVFLTFLQNLHDIMGLVLKKDLNLSPKKDGGPASSKFVYHSICLLSRYLARQKNEEFVQEWGGKLYYRDPEFRTAVRTQLMQSGIRSEFAKRLMALNSFDTAEVNDAFETCKNVLYLKDHINPFEYFAELDADLIAA